MIVFGIVMTIGFRNDICTQLWQILKLTKQSIWISVQTCCILPILLSVLLVKMFGVYGIIIAILISNILSGFTILIISCIKNNKMPKDAFEYLLLNQRIKDVPGISRTIYTIDDAINSSKDLQAFCEAQNIDKRTSYYISLCLEEMAVNVIEHGFTKMKDASNGAIDMFAYVDDGQVTLRIRDNSVAFDPNERFKILMDDEDITKHIGIKMVKKLQKEMKYQSLISKNVLIIKI